MKVSADLEIKKNSEKHCRNFRGDTSFEKLTKYFVKSNSKLVESVCDAEGTLAFRTVAHHNSFKSMDCTSKLLREMFNDYEVAKRISSARTKTEAIVNSVLAPHAVQEVLKSLQGILFCEVSMDASKHGAVKIFPILIQYFDYENGGLQIKLLEVESKPNETAHTIAVYVSETLSNYGLLSKCVTYEGDNCNTMFGGLKKGGGKNVLANLKNIIKQSLIGVGCPAHVLTLCRSNLNPYCLGRKASFFSVGI
jgi:hypothetical protein